MKHPSADQFRDQNIRVMGPDMGKLYSALWHKVFTLYNNWGEFSELFLSDPHRVDLINDCASQFFGMMQDIMAEHIVIQFYRITDSPGSGSGKNVTIRNIPSLIDPSEKDKVNSLVNDAVLSRESLVNWRNKVFAHLDYAVIANNKTKLLDKLDEETINECINKIIAVLNFVEGHYEISLTAFDNTRGFSVRPLLSILSDGLSLSQERQRLEHNGEFVPEFMRRSHP